MRSFLDVMKVSAVGAILLSALAACQSKPESNPTPPPSDDDQVEVIIEQVVDGKVVDTRAIGRTDVVKYTGKTDGDDVAQIGWPDDVNCRDKFDFTYYAKPGLYLKAGGYRFNQTEDPQMTTFGIDTYGQTEAIKEVQQKVTCYPKGNKRIYVRLEYKKIQHLDYVLKIDQFINDLVCPKDRQAVSGGFGVSYKYEERNSEVRGYPFAFRLELLPSPVKQDLKPLPETLTLALVFNKNLRRVITHTSYDEYDYIKNYVRHFWNSDMLGDQFWDCEVKLTKDEFGHYGAVFDSTNLADLIEATLDPRMYPRNDWENFEQVLLLDSREPFLKGVRLSCPTDAGGYPLVVVNPFSNLDLIGEHKECVLKRY